MSFFKSVRNSLGIDIERPPYQVIEKIDDNMEIRKYGKTKWVCTSTNGKAQALQYQNSGSMFGKLFQYISGQNNESQKISMTSPVTFDYRNTKAEKIDNNSDCQLAMRFYVPREFQENTPTPTGDAYLEEDPEMIVASIRFGGYASMNDYMTMRDVLIKRLGADAQNYDCVNMMVAGYDPPFKPIGRTNEVWLKKIAF